MIKMISMIVAFAMWTLFPDSSGMMAVPVPQRESPNSTTTRTSDCPSETAPDAAKQPSSFPIVLQYVSTVSYRLHWSELFDNGSPVIRYHLTYWKTLIEGDIRLHRTVPAPASFVQLVDLEPIANYTVELTSENVLGVSMPTVATFSSGSNFQASFPTGRVCNVTILDQTATTIEFAFVLCQSQVEVDGFEARFTNTSAGADQRVHICSWLTNEADSYRIGHLQPGATYNFKIYARNRFGTGAHSGSRKITMPPGGLPHRPLLLPSRKFYYRLQWIPFINRTVAQYSISYWKNDSTPAEPEWRQSAFAGRREYLDVYGLEPGATYHLSIRTETSAPCISFTNTTFVAPTGLT